MNVRMPGTPCSASRDALDDLPSTRHRGGGAMRDAVLSERTAILIESIYCIRAHTTPIPARNCVQSPDYEDIDSMDVASEAKRR
ncbi:hypothetical protein PsYK624_156460 [Phanerochaete sordida]|uniref:Uncharacterized protein n=1 Tax=Phanerochaete sordida TaxID=48140 RepID=A0A9P3GPL1_9APHY|nr:hypothetical protein PsYK624_156460 [Phanerochaete sordida]